MQHEAGSRHSDGVAERDCATVHVEARIIDSQTLHGCNGNGGECFIDLHEVEVGNGDPLFGARRLDRRRRLFVK